MQLQTAEDCSKCAQRQQERSGRQWSCATSVGRPVPPTRLIAVDCESRHHSHGEAWPQGKMALDRGDSDRPVNTLYPYNMFYYLYKHHWQIENHFVCVSVSQSVSLSHKRVERSAGRNLPPIFTKLAAEGESQEMRLSIVFSGNTEYPCQPDQKWD